MDKIVDMSINAEVSRVFDSSKPKLDIRKTAIDMADKGLAQPSTDAPYERQTYQVLKRFAEEHIKEGETDFKKIIDIMTYPIRPPGKSKQIEQ